MTTDYCDRSHELMLCAQLLHQKVMSGRVILKPRKSRPGAIEAYFAHTTLKTQLIPLVYQASNSLYLGQAKMDQIIKLTERLTFASTTDKVLVTSIFNLTQNLQSEVLAISSFMQQVARVSSEVLREFSGHPQVCKHVKSLVSVQESRLAELSRRLRDYMESNKAIVSDQYEDTPVVTAPLIDPPPTKTSVLMASVVPPAQVNNKRPTPGPCVEDRRRGETEALLISDQAYPYQQHQQQQMVVRQREAQSENATAIRHTEATIVQLGQIYEQFAFLVRDQADVVMRIDGNVEDAAANVNFAHESLVEFLRHVSDRRAFMLKFFAILFAIFVLFAIFKR
nr:syntaxin 5 [Hymenolepis microstoma]